MPVGEHLEVGGGLTVPGDPEGERVAVGEHGHPDAHPVGDRHVGQQLQRLAAQARRAAARGPGTLVVTVVIWCWGSRQPSRIPQDTEGKGLSSAAS